MNYAKPPDAKPLLMSVQEVRGLFHEIGHSMHNILSITKFARFHGSRYAGPILGNVHSPSKKRSPPELSGADVEAM